MGDMFCVEAFKKKWGQEKKEMESFRTMQVVLDSRERESGTPYEFVVRLSVPVRGVVAVRLLQTEVIDASLPADECLYIKVNDFQMLKRSSTVAQPDWLCRAFGGRQLYQHDASLFLDPQTYLFEHPERVFRFDVRAEPYDQTVATDLTRLTVTLAIVYLPSHNE